MYSGVNRESGQVSPFNDAGQLAFAATFTDGTSGISVATLPEPATVALLGLGLLAVTRRRVHRRR